ncbi:hypothetical protein [Marinagarivorans cellulosilyticus]|uniref:Uncharacterized protein n=1 Tax=Marinagarivorans cellulosilyticus TaxID=2721545 RepID=A0AAN1WI89_9GAMM|nr:hypothetical protein [Marinagarivorans cellulosilyticus]BCD98106.1 hypothetical protein MARGE09_P2307 [Marinagarivorans cellulosilyticus]
MDHDKANYIWKNYRYLINRENSYSQYMRAALFSINESWPDAAEIKSLQLQFSREELTEKFQEIDRNREFHVSVACAKYGDEIYFNYCASCGALAVAPGSERCVQCGHTWYGTNQYRKNS